MSDRHSDADLIRICLEGSAEDLTESVVAQINERIAESALLREAIHESPISGAIHEQISVSIETSGTGPQNTEQRSPGFARLAAFLLFVGAVTGGGLWWKNQFGNKGELPDSSHETASTDFGSDNDERSALEGNLASLPSDNAEPQVEESPGSKPKSNDDLPDKNSVEIQVADTAPSKVDEPSLPENQVATATTPNGTSSAGTETGSVDASKKMRPVPGPWSEELSLDAPPRRFEEIAWQVPGEEGADEFPPAVFQQWFSRQPGKPFQVAEEKVSNRLFSRFSGIAKLKAPWIDSAVLRLGLYDTERCRLTVWSGNRGVQLRYYRHRNPNVWGVCSVSRAGTEGDDALPRPGRFLTSDGGRWHRSNFGVFDLRWDDGTLRIVRGDVVLLAAPFKQKPDEVVLDGKLKIRQVRMFRSNPLPDYVVNRTANNDTQNILDTTRPADLEWSLTDVPDGGFSKNESDGSVLLTTDSGSDKRALAFSMIPNAGLSEVIFRVNSMDSGTGIYFGRTNGEQIFRISCVWDTGGNKPALWFQRAGQYEVERRFDAESYVVPWIGKKQWIRVVAGYGITTVQMSPDGVNWGWIIDNPSRTDWERVESIGLFAEPKGERQIELSSISVNEFSTLPTVADPQLVSKVDITAFEPLNVLDVGAWLHKVMRQQPKGVSFSNWRRACAVATLRARPRAPLGTFLLNGLLADGAFPEGSDASKQSDNRLPRDKWKLLSECSELVSPLDYSRAVQFQHLHHELARREVTQRVAPLVMKAGPSNGEGTSIYSVVGETASRLLRLPMQANQAIALTAREAARQEVIGLLESSEHERARQLVNEIIFWNSNAHPSRAWWSQVDPIYPTLAWAELQSRQVVDSDDQTTQSIPPRRWKTTLVAERHPLAQPVSKEAYNVMAEFQAAVDGEAFQDACQVISSAGAANLIGLLPDAQDDQLLVSFPNAVAMAMDRYPQLRQQMNERFGAIGRLRVRQAIENGDYRQVEAATIQFFGTPAAAESDLWLGNRAMSSGHFAQARSYFERAVHGFQMNSQIETTEIASAMARLKVVESLLGEKSDAPSVREVTQTVSFGSQQLSPEQLSALVTELSESRSQQSSSGISDLQKSAAPGGRFDVPRIPRPLAHRMENRGRWEGDLGEHVGRSAPADTDWVSRQLAWTIVGDRAFVNNRFQVRCLDLTNGSTKWNQQLGGDHGSAHHWPMLAMRPLVLEDSLVCRRLTKKGTELARFQMTDGKIFWKQQFEQILVSDPFLVRGRLQVLSTNQSSIGPTVLNLLTLNRETGAIISTFPVLKLFDAWQNTAMVCQVAVHDAKIFISTVGAVACCNVEGQTLWVRRRGWTPTKLDSRYRYARSWSAPVIANDRLIIGQPESPMIDCLNTQTGRPVWQHVEPELRRFVTHDQKDLLVETRAGLKSIAVETGQTIWKYSAADLLDGIAVGPLERRAEPNSSDSDQLEKNCILAVRHVPNQEGRTNTPIPTLVWIDAETGEEFARQRFDSLRDRESRVGPLFITKDRFFAFKGKNRKEGKRDIVELVPEPDQALHRPIDQDLMAAWHPEFLLSSFADNHRGRPNLIGPVIQRDSRNGLDALCPGWVMIAPPQPGNMGKRDEHRGQKNVFELRLQPRSLTDEQRQALAGTPVNAIRLLREIRVPSGNQAALKFKAGHNPDQSWNLTIDVDGQQVHSGVVNNETAPTGWLPIQTSLQQWVGKNVKVLVTCSLTPGSKQTSIFLSEMNSSLPAQSDLVD